LVFKEAVVCREAATLPACLLLCLLACFSACLPASLPAKIKYILKVEKKKKIYLISKN
jgi:hypothetical protein